MGKAPAVQTYAVPPNAVRLAVCPLHIVGELTVIDGNAFTVIVIVVSRVHVPDVPVTVYVTIPVGGLAITVAPVDIFKFAVGNQVYVVAPLAVSDTLLPAQMLPEAGETVIGKDVNNETV